MKQEDKIEVVDYDPDWPRAFLQEQARILNALGERIMLIEHIGSTAIPGLAAKDTIDLMVGVLELRVDDEIITGMERLGYKYFGVGAGRE